MLNAFITSRNETKDNNSNITCITLPMDTKELNNIVYDLYEKYGKWNVKFDKTDFLTDETANKCRFMNIVAVNSFLNKIGNISESDKNYLLFQQSNGKDIDAALSSLISTNKELKRERTEEEKQQECLLRVIELSKKYNKPIEELLDYIYKTAPDEYIDGIPYDVVTIKIDNINQSH